MGLGVAFGGAFDGSMECCRGEGGEMVLYWVKESEGGKRVDWVFD